VKLEEGVVREFLTVASLQAAENAQMHPKQSHLDMKAASLTQLLILNSI
jgi:hypothetical protein